MARGTIVILNGAPRSGKSSIANALAALEPNQWTTIGVDDAMANHTPSELLPGIGLRPGGERPDIEASLPGLYTELYDRVVAAAARGRNVAVDVGHHHSYCTPIDTLAIAAAACDGFATWFMGVICPVQIVVARRGASRSPYATFDADGQVANAVLRWQEAVHDNAGYDATFDTSVATPETIAAEMLRLISSGSPSVLSQAPEIREHLVPELHRP